MMTTQATALIPGMKDAWGLIFLYTDVNQLKNYRLISKQFSAVLENSCAAVCIHYKLGIKNGESSLRRIINLGALMKQWIRPEDAGTISQRVTKTGIGEVDKEKVMQLLLYPLIIGINPFDYRFKEIDPNNDLEMLPFIDRKIVFDYMRLISMGSYEDCSQFFSIQDFLESLTKATVSAISIMDLTPNIFPNHPAKEDYRNLLANYIDDFKFALKNNPEKADEILIEKSSLMKDDDIINAIRLYLCNYDIDRLRSLLKLVKNRQWEKETEDRYPGIQVFLSLSNDEKIDNELVFVKFLICFKDNIEFSLGREIISHVAESGNTSLLNKLKEEYPDRTCKSCFHYAKTAAVAEALFELMPQFSVSMLHGRSPLMTAFWKNNKEVAEYLISQNCTLRGDETKTLVRFLFSKSPNESKWFVLKELIYRVIRAVAICLAAIGAMYIVLAACFYLGLKLGVIVPISEYSPNLSAQF